MKVVFHKYTTNNLNKILILILFTTFVSACTSVVKFTSQAVSPNIKDKNKELIGDSIASYSYKLKGLASYYADKFHGKATASGEIYDMNDFTAAHRTLPFGTKVKVINISNDRSVVVRINDRGPFKSDRIIDLSKAAAETIDMIGPGVVEVELIIIE